jgi:hypothetical protein
MTAGGGGSGRGTLPSTVAVPAEPDGFSVEAPGKGRQKLKNDVRKRRRVGKLMFISGAINKMDSPVVHEGPPAAIRNGKAR